MFVGQKSNRGNQNIIYCITMSHFFLLNDLQDKNDGWMDYIDRSKKKNFFLNSMEKVSLLCIFFQ
jgi:hypothetical protein